jgi:hypothetical protein
MLQLLVAEGLLVKAPERIVMKTMGTLPEFQIRQFQYLPVLSVGEHQKSLIWGVDLTPSP